MNGWLQQSTKGAAILSLLLCALMLVACSGVNTVAPEEQERQSFEDFRETIKDVIEGSDRQQEILGLVEAVQLDFKNLRATVGEQRAELRSLNADYDATQEQFQAFIDKYDAGIRAARKQATDSRMAFVRATTNEEWAALKKADANVMKTMVNTIQGI
jgi:hypothetical protein